MKSSKKLNSSILFLEDQKRFVLETKNTAYCFDISEKGHLIYVYWGKKLLKEDYPLLRRMSSNEGRSFTSPTRGSVGYEYAPWGEMVYSEPTLKTRILGLDRGMSLEYKNYSVRKEGQEDILCITLEDVRGYYKVNLEYVIYAKYDVIAKRQIVKNLEKGKVAIEAIRSFQTSLPRGNNYRLTKLVGVWGGESHIAQDLLTTGKTTIESRNGHTGPTHNPWFAIDHSATETDGEIWSGHLGYSGNWEINIEQDAIGFTQISGGIHSFDFEWLLDKGETISTPYAYLSYTDKGFGEMSRKAHTFQREQILPEKNRKTERKVLYNSWYATYFDVNEDNQMKLAEKAAELGVELFVIDDGWFGERYTDNAGLGDWYVNTSKFPNGLQPLIDKVHALNMEFGLWVEPEMTNENSKLFKNHPDWIYHFKGIESSTSRNQYVLNFGREDVREHILNQLITLLSTYSIDFIKWDMNRSFSQVGWPDIAEGRQKEVWVRHVLGLYEVMRKIRDQFPNIVIESCAGGGARVDLGILKYTDQVWVSDNTDAYDRLFIQEGYSYAYNPKTMVGWVTDVPNFLNNRTIPMKFRFLTSMMGTLGVGGNLNEWTENDMVSTKKYINQYKNIRHIVQEGNLYRLLSPTEFPYTGVQFISKDESEIALFSFYAHQRNDRKQIQFKLQGLDENALYECKQLDLLASGKYFMEHGLFWRIRHDYDSELFYLRKVNI